MIPILRPHYKRELERALDRAVAADPSLAPARSALLAPLRVLLVAAEEAELVLQGSSDAMRRLRLVLAASAGRAFALQEFVEPGSAATLDSEEGDDGPVAGRQLSHAHSGRCTPGIVHLGALVIVALAAGRVGRRQRQPAVFVDAVLAVAMSAAPAEAIMRALRAGLTEAELEVVLAGLAHPGSGDTGVRATLATLLDDCETRRRDCLKQLFRHVRKQARHALWEPVVSSGIESVTPKAEDLLIRFGVSDSHEVGEPHLVLDEPVHVVLRSAEGFEHVPGHVDSKSKKEGRWTIRATLPAGARAGAVGLFGPTTYLAANDAWKGIRELWRAESEKNLCLAQEPVPLELLPQSLVPPTEPPPRASAQWGARIMSIDLSQQNEPLEEGFDTRIAAAIDPAEPDAKASVTVVGQVEPLALAIHDGAATATIPKAWVHAPRLEGAVKLVSETGNRTLDERKFSTAVKQAATPVPPVTTPGPVVITPAFFAQGSLVRAKRRALADRAATTPVYLSDADLFFPSLPLSPDDPVTTDVLERLEALSARTVGLDRQPWVLVVPKGSVKWHRIAPSGAARALIVATEDALEDLELPPATDDSVPTHRLRIIGKIVGDDVAITEPVREERIRSNADAPYLTDIVAVAIDDDGRPVTSRRLGVQSEIRSGTFALLLPVSDRVRRIELRRQSELLALEVDIGPRVSNAPFSADDRSGFEFKARAAVAARLGQPRTSSLVLYKNSARPTVRLLDARLDGHELVVHWEYSHGSGLRSRLEIELGSAAGDVWSRCAVTGASDSEARISVGALDARFTHVRAVASDGWNTAADVRELAGAGERREDNVVMRRTATGFFWVDAANDSSVRWQLTRTDGTVRTGEAFAFLPEAKDAGTLVAEVTRAGTQVERFELAITRP